jgi:chemotaxis protein histidine kinase CheA
VPLEILEPQVFDRLDRDLNGLSRRAIQINAGDSKAAMELAETIGQWSAAAGQVRWSASIHRQAQETLHQLKSGLPAAKAMEQILRTLLQAHRLLETEKKGEMGKEAVPGPVAGFPSRRPADEPGRDTMAIRPEDLGLFQQFLRDAPGLLSGIQFNLLLLSSGQKADLHQLYQLFHFLKGQWGFLGFLQMRQLCHEAEALLEPALVSSQAPCPDHLDLLRKALEACRSQTDCIARGLSKEKVEIEDASLVLAEIRNQLSFLSPSPTPDSLRISPEPTSIAFAADDFFRIRTVQMERLLELTADLVLSQASLIEETPDSSFKGKKATDAARMVKLTHQMRDLLLSLRMAPLKPLFDHLALGLDLLSRQRGKTVLLALDGPNIEVDQELIPRLAGALTDLIRNRVDQGIETPKERVKAGKPPEGMLKIKAVQQAGTVILEVEDDGRGLNPDFDGEGGGTGLERVKEQVESLQGSIRVQSRPGLGCKFVMKLPRTEALIEGWVVEAAGERCLLPLSQVKKITHPAPAGMEKGLPAAEAALPTVDLGYWMAGKKSEDAALFLVHVESCNRVFRLMVDEVHGKQQALVRTNNGKKAEKPGVRGEGILPDGKAVWILDTRQFVQSVEKS